MKATSVRIEWEPSGVRLFNATLHVDQQTIERIESKTKTDVLRTLDEWKAKFPDNIIELSPGMLL